MWPIIYDSKIPRNYESLKITSGSISLKTSVKTNAISPCVAQVCMSYGLWLIVHLNNGLKNLIQQGW